MTIYPVQNSNVIERHTGVWKVPGQLTLQCGHAIVLGCVYYKLQKTPV